MIRRVALTLSVCASASGAHVTIASAAGTTIAGVHGVCHELVLAGRSISCDQNKVLIYTVTDIGRVLLTVPAGPHQLVAFVAEHDRQPSPGSYFTYLDHVDIDTTSLHSVANVAGECKVHMTTDARHWYSVDCDAQDATGAPYVLHFTGNDQPVIPTQIPDRRGS